MQDLYLGQWPSVYEYKPPPALVSASQLPHLEQCWPQPSPNPPPPPGPYLGISPHICERQFLQAGKYDIGTLELLLVQCNNYISISEKDCQQ
jgi:hypothetical protein